MPFLRVNTLMSKYDTIYDELGVRRVINGVGTRTQVGGARMHGDVVDAMKRAAESHVYVAELQAAASDLIADVTGGEAGFVTPGAAAGMVLSAAACLCGDDFEKMASLPDTSDLANEIIIPKAHRIKYDVALRASGATLVDVGLVSHHPVDGGVDRVEPWEIESKITDRTAAIAYVQRPHNVLELSTVTEIAHEHDIPVIVDAANEVPPPRNLERFHDEGADLVVFSGGKGIGGPQPTGIVSGRRDLIRSVALQQLPDGYHEDLWSPPESLIDVDQLPRGTPVPNLGRPLKVGPEEIVGVMTALEAFAEADHDVTLAEWRERAARIADGLESCPHLDVRLSDGHDKASGVPKVIGRVVDGAPLSALELIRSLREENPRVWLGERRVHLDEFTVSPQELTDDEATYLVERVLAQF